MKLANHGVDVFHCQYAGPPFSVTPYIVTLHDIIHETYPEFYPKLLRFFMRLFYPFSARRAVKVLTGSEYTKSQINRLFKIPAERIEVTPYGASEEFRIIDDSAAIKRIAASYGVHGRYILFVGRIEPRKNIQGLLKAYEIVKGKYNIDQKLVIVGMKDSSFEDFYQDLRAKKVRHDVIFTGGVSQEDLPYIYNGADLFVYPSFAEGFGLPVLEAMACGTTVITSNSTALPELVGDAGIMVDAKNTEELAEAIYKVLKDSNLRNRLKNKGLEQSKLFSWHKTAEKVLDIYREVCKSDKSWSLKKAF
ncbi:MAG: glycosyltransferase [Candidatus Aenigmarchaeota archaeon]|nr:glycosyltransferase [Candidatus Aenigmarchaeota archaeon]